MPRKKISDDGADEELAPQPAKVPKQKRKPKIPVVVPEDAQSFGTDSATADNGDVNDFSAADAQETNGYADGSIKDSQTSDAAEKAAMPKARRSGRTKKLSLSDVMQPQQRMSDIKPKDKEEIHVRDQQETAPEFEPEAQAIADEAVAAESISEAAAEKNSHEESGESVHVEEIDIDRSGKHQSVHERRFSYSNSHDLHNDAAFLAPEVRSFGLKRKSRGAWLKPLVYFLGTVIIIVALVLLGLTIYAAKIRNQAANSGINVDTLQNQNASQPAAQSQYKLAIIGAPQNLGNFLFNSFNNGLKEVIIDNSGQATVPAAVPPAADTLYFKGSAQQESTNLVNFLKQQGISPQIQQSDSLQDDFVLYLVNPLKSVDLSMFTAVVYNASGKSGVAKTYCGYLKAYRVSSCNALNATTSASGLNVYYKDPKIFAQLVRTVEFQNAVFTLTQQGQVEDIKVIVGK